jgi:uncharacterized membrane protein YoaK (UPF0700 family)
LTIDLAAPTGRPRDSIPGVLSGDRVMASMSSRLTRVEYFIGGLIVTEVQAAKPSFWAPFVRDPAHGPLPALLLGLTAMTGLIDAVSILGLGRVFVANMTGNVAFIGFALAGAPGFSLSASIAALLGFLAGALVGGVLVARFEGHRGLMLRNGGVAEFALMAIAFLLVLPSVGLPDPGVAAAVASLLAAAMGIQNATARRLAVPDLTTTVLTMTLTGIAADLRHSPIPIAIRRILAVLTMLLGAFVGALLVLTTGLVWALGLALILLGAVVGIAARQSRQAAAWHVHSG